jgi:phage gp16-like protein
MKGKLKNGDPNASRKASLAKIHVARKRLDLDEPTYRALVARVCGGKTSSADLDQLERSKLLDEFKRLGFLEGEGATLRTKSMSDFPDAEPQARLIRALWADCTSFGLIEDGSDKALRQFIRRTTKIDDIRFLTAIDANKVIEGLKAMKKRAGFRRQSIVR